MHQVKDFARLFNCTTRTIHVKLRELKPMLKNFDITKRKRQYTDSEAMFVIAELKKVIKIKVKKEPLNLSEYLNSLGKND